MLSGAFGNGTFQASQNRDAFLIKLNQSGSVIWQREYDREFTTVHVSELLELPDGSLVVTGGDYVSADGDVYGGIHKYDSEGTPMWSRLYAGEDLTKDNYLYDIVSTADGGFLALGSTYDPNLSNRQEAWLLRLDSEGYTCDSVGCVEVVNALPPPLREEEALTISPNPSTGLLTAQWQTEGMVELSVFTATGRQAWAYQGKSEGPMTIDLSHLPPGLYLFTLRAGGKLLFRKFILSN